MAAKGALRGIVQRLIENLSQQGDTGDNKVLLIRQLRSSNNWTALRAAERLRSLGTLEDGSLHQANLAYANLSGADLHRANLNHANLKEANLRGTNLQEARLSGVDLVGADLSMSNLFRADLSSGNLFRARLVQANLQETFLFQADLRGADFQDANLRAARLNNSRLDSANISLNQLIQVGMLAGTIVPDGSRYDGRFNLSGDIQFAQFLDLELDVNDPAKMAEFYEVSVETYRRGQEWAHEFLKRLREQFASSAESPAAIAD